MTDLTFKPMPRWAVQAWSATALSGVVAPVLMLLAMGTASTPPALAGGQVFTLGLMGVGIIGTATTGNFWTGALLALLNMTCLLVLALVLGMSVPSDPISTALAAVIASGSFAARGALFSISLSTKGWLMGLFVVAGEASILLTAAFLPGLLPDWLLALLPAQWSSSALEASLTGAVAFSANWSLIALAGTAVTTLFTARRWPRRWPYLVMFTSWLGFSALVYFSSSPTTG